MFLGNLSVGTGPSEDTPNRTVSRRSEKVIPLRLLSVKEVELSSPIINIHRVHPFPLPVLTRGVSYSTKKDLLKYSSTYVHKFSYNMIPSTGTLMKQIKGFQQHIGSYKIIKVERKRGKGVSSQILSLTNNLRVRPSLRSVTRS